MDIVLRPFPRLRKDILKITYVLVAVYSVLHFLNGAFGYQGYGDFFLILENARDWIDAGKLSHEFGAYTPFYLLLMYPFVPLSAGIVIFLMHVLNLSCLAILVKVAYEHFGRSLAPEQKVKWLSLSLVLLLNYRPLLLGLSMIKIEFLELALIALAFHHFRKGRDVYAGSLLAIGAALKFLPGVYLAYFLWKRQWRVVLSGIMTGIGILLLTISIFGLPYHLEYVQTLAGGFSPWVDNQSFEAVFLRWFAPFPPTSVNPYVTVDPAWMWVIPLIKIACLACLLWLTRKPIRERSSVLWDWEASLWMLAVPFLLRFFRDYYAVFFIPVFFAFAHRLIQSSQPRWPFLLPFAVGYLLIGQFFPIGVFTRLPPVFPNYGNFDLFLFLSFPLYGYVILFIWSCLSLSPSSSGYTTNLDLQDSLDEGTVDLP